MQSDQDYLNALAFLTALKELSEADIKLLAERYYNVGDYTTVEVKPVPFLDIAKKVGSYYKHIQSELSGIEERLGGIFESLQPKLKVKVATDQLTELENFTLSCLLDHREQELIRQSFIRIRENREKALSQ